MKTLPREIGLEISRKKDTGREWDAKELLCLFNKELESRERAMFLMDTIHDPYERPPISKPKGDVKATKRGIPSSFALNTNSQTHQCLFCSKTDHTAANCKEFGCEEKRECLKKNGRCFNCFGIKHMAKFCRNKSRCTFCQGKHHSVICLNREAEGTKYTANTMTAENDAVISSLAPDETRDSACPSVLLQTAQVWLTEPSGRKQTVRCMFDGGSQRTFIREDVSRKLNLKVCGTETLKIHTFGKKTPSEVTCRRVSFNIKGIRSPHRSIELEALETPLISSALIKVPEREVREILKDKGLCLAEQSENETSKQGLELHVLLGSDCYWQVVTGRIERLTCSLVALETIFGWTVQGQTCASNFVQTPTPVSIHKVLTEGDDLTSERLRAFWEIESLGITDKADSTKMQDQEIVAQFESTICYDNGRYRVQLPWNSDRCELADNYQVAVKRLESLKKRFSNDVVLYQSYDQVIRDQVAEGMIEEVDILSKDAAEGKEIVHYIPHHPVIREDKQSSKLRIVYDASSHEKGKPSLNDCLLTGPNLNPCLIDVLIKFRIHKIALTADITKAFLQIELAEGDRDVVRFLWWQCNPNGSKNTKLLAYRFTRVPFGVKSSPFLLAATVRHHLKKFSDEDTRVCKMLDECLYIDDLLSGAEIEDEAIQIGQRASNILGQAGMQLCKWRSNSLKVQNALDDNKTRQAPDEHKQSYNVHPKVLGLTWNSEKDIFMFDVGQLLDFLLQRKNTKRGVLQASARLFDPLGFVSPYIIRVKCLFQEIWEHGLQWDEELPQILREKWDAWSLELPDLHQLSIPRSYFSTGIISGIGEIQLHGFCDASQTAYGAVIFIRCCTNDQEFYSDFVISKSRVAPLKKLTLPRLELMGAVILSRLLNHVQKIFPHVHRTFLWTDSMIVLHWIKGTAKQWKPFVANRVSEIQTLTDPIMWSHCDGRSNPADLCTRGQEIRKLKENELWWHGPHWLQQHESHWPRSREIFKPETVSDEMRPKSDATIQFNCETESAKPVLDLIEHSSYVHVLRLTCWILRFVHNTRNLNNKVTGSISYTELMEAEKYWIRLVQRDCFSEEVRLLQNGKQISRTSKLITLNPYLDTDNILRVRSRLSEADISGTEKEPYILPDNHRFAELFIHSCHVRLLHAGLRDTLTQIREKFWIIRGRRMTKNVISKCLPCRKMTVKRAAQTVAPLPKDRITETPPFETTGVDFAGPLYAKFEETSEKVYILLFTCAVTRAIHLELVTGMSTKCFILAFKRFISRRGITKIIYSDNAKSFKKADRDLQDLWKKINNEELRKYFGTTGITWKYSAERAPWWGGFFERMIRSVKTALKKILGKACLKYEELETVLTEVEAIINSRPLTYVYYDPHEPTALTPAHFLIGRRLTSLPTPSISVPETTRSTKAELQRRLKYRENILNQFWRRWKKEYLLELRTAHFESSKRKSHDLQVDDFVLIQEDKTPRPLWKTGRVMELFYGRDKKVRACKIKLPGGSVIRRAVQTLYQLEIK